MSLKIKNASSEEVKVTQLKMLIYGSPGSGKTSLAFTSKKPLLLDFDKGSYRAGNRSNFVEVNSWSDVVGIQAADIKEFDTIIIDTAGQMLTTMSNHLVATNKTAVKRSGELSLQGYGILKSMFDTFMNRIISMGKDVILIAHDKEQKNEEETIFRPDIAGGSFQIIKRAMDFIGYLGLNENGKRELNFNPTTKTIGKNCAYLNAQLIPNNISTEFDSFLNEIFVNAKNLINVQAKEGKNFYEYRRKIASLELAEEFDELANEMQNESKDLKNQLRNLIGERIKTLGIIYDKQLSKFIQTKPENDN